MWEAPNIAILFNSQMKICDCRTVTKKCNMIQVVKEPEPWAMHAVGACPNEHSFIPNIFADCAPFRAGGAVLDCGHLTELKRSGNGRSKECCTKKGEKSVNGAELCECMGFQICCVASSHSHGLCILVISHASVDLLIFTLWWVVKRCMQAPDKVITSTAAMHTDVADIDIDR